MNINIFKKFHFNFSDNIQKNDFQKDFSCKMFIILKNRKEAKMIEGN